jgi:hypothetical protein
MTSPRSIQGSSTGSGRDLVQSSRRYCRLQLIKQQNVIGKLSPKNSRSLLCQNSPQNLQVTKSLSVLAICDNIQRSVARCCFC